jgi:Glycosyl transferase family 2
VHLVTVVGGYAGVLPHMLAHYRALGVRSFIVHVHAASDTDPVLHQVEQITREFGCGIASVTVGEWLHNTNRTLYRQAMQSRPNDWFLIADQDELQIYPRDLNALLAHSERRGCDYIEGCFLDRFARDGSFPEVLPNESIWHQFPLAGFVSAPVLEANPNKIVVARGFVELGPGQHYAFSGRGCPPEELYIPVHHFKWVSGVLDRLAHRTEFRRQRNDRYWQESQRFVDHCRAHGGRLDIAEPSFYLAEALPDYPHWREVKRLSMEMAARLR